jgi:hypothetical protein
VDRKRPLIIFSEFASSNGGGNPLPIGWPGFNHYINPSLTHPKMVSKIAIGHKLPVRPVYLKFDACFYFFLTGIT